MPLRVAIALYAGSLLICSACARHSLNAAGPRQQGADGARTTSRRAGHDVITAEELRSVKAASLLEAIERLRPEFLKPRLDLPSGPTLTAPKVYLDDGYAGETSVLSSIPPIAVVEVRYLSSSRAQDRYGAYCNCSGGVIQVRVRR